MFAAAVCGIVFGAIQLDEYGSGLGAFLLALGVVCTPLGCILCPGFKVLNPNEAVVLTLFGKYYGTIKRDGFFWTCLLYTSREEMRREAYGFLPDG